ncbi:MAG: CP2 transcription factor-domain-containing protein [Benjaminiella poitrasii]|nr:MAG: CP2 transcription factor-domain-containing protein [Benjaminiella poitrasii]
MDLSSLSTLEANATMETVTSTISLAFHEPSHRSIAENYWKYWISQQETRNEARAIHLDHDQCTGIFNVRLVSFDRVSFDWNSRFGAKVYVRFNCLSTDFSRIKGVKGIPMRAVVETECRLAEIPNNSDTYKGIFRKLGDTALYEYKESCYCKIKLFRDKGAERKNKDERKQLTKQLEKINASAMDNHEQHPLWFIINQPESSTTSLTESESSPNMPTFNLDNPIHHHLSIPQHQLDVSSLYKRKRSMTDQPQQQQQQQQRTRRHESKDTSQVKRIAKPATAALHFFVWTYDFPHLPRQVVLDSCTTQDLKLKLAGLLFIHPSKISEMLWRRKRTAEDSNSNDVLVLIEDAFITEHILDGEMITLNWGVKADGDIRLILEF